MKKNLTIIAITSFLVGNISSFAFALSAPLTPAEEPSTNVCAYEMPEESRFSAEIVTIRRKLRVEPGEKLRVKVFLKNTGNTPWFSANTNCGFPTVSLGTDHPRDRKSVLEPATRAPESNWKTLNRIYMDQSRVEPGQIASFTFYAQAPKAADVYKEYFTPVVEGREWMEKATFSVEFLIGNTKDSPKILREKLSLSSSSGSVSSLDLNGPRKIVIDISEQKMFIYLGDRLVRSFRVSTGKASTPTPYGETKILLKQEVRVGYKWPHYVMPKFLMFRAGGYGIHALPSLANDGGIFWTEARNHIGIPVSHGCIRLLPEDADFLFDFTPVGTTVVVQP